MSAHIVCGDVGSILPTIDDNSFDAVLTDPPYGISLLGHRWDYEVPSITTWQTILRVCKPGAPILSFSAPRTLHRMTCNLEDAGADIRDLLMWIYPRGKPNFYNVDKQVDKAAGHWRGRQVEKFNRAQNATSGGDYVRTDKEPPITPEAKLWEGYGTGLKPAYEPIILARKPIVGRMTDNISQYGCGPLNVAGGSRWPTNIGLDDETVLGEVSRYFYCGKVTPQERGALTHPTMKPLALTSWLAHLVKPPTSDARLLVPFCGVGSEVVGAVMAGWSTILGIEQNPEYVHLARERITSFQR